MAEIIAEGSKQSPIKVIWSDLTSLDKFTKLFLLTSLLVVLSVPFTKSLIFDTRQHAAQVLTPPDSPTPTPPLNPIVFDTNDVNFAADNFYIDANGKRFYGNVQMLQLHSNVGSPYPSTTTMEAIWNENGVEMRLFVYFRRDPTRANGWEIYDIRTNNGKNPGDWYYYPANRNWGNFGNLGYSAFWQKVELYSTTGDGLIHFDNLRIFPYKNYHLSPTPTPSPISSPTPTPKPIAYVQSFANTVAFSNNKSISVYPTSSDIAVGNTVMVAVSTGTFAGTVGCKDSKGNVYTVVGRSTARSLFVCSGKITTALHPNDTITATYPQFSGTSVMVADEFSGISAQDGTFKTGSSTTTLTVSAPNLTTTAAPELIYGAVASKYNTNYYFFASPGYQSTVAGGLSTAYKIATTKGTFSTFGTLRSGPWTSILTAFK